MHKICFALTLILHCLFASLSLSAEIKAIHSLNEISTEAFSSKTLVMFDLDDVLVYPQDALMQNWRSGWKPEGARDWSSEEDTIAWANLKFQLMDPSGPEFINTLNATGIPAIGFTSFAMDDPTIVTSIPDWRHQHLQELGLHFIVEQDITFPAYSGFISPSFDYGVLYCGNVYKKDPDNKGKVLSLYLDQLDWTPDLVVFIDDGKSHVQSVKRELRKRGIPFQGFLYLPKDLDPIDQEIAELQYNTLIHEQRWISDTEAYQQKLSSSLSQNEALLTSFGR